MGVVSMHQYRQVQRIMGARRRNAGSRLAVSARRSGADTGALEPAEY
jgi:hypothetical protein